MGTTTTKKYFYLPALGASGQAELDLYNAGQQVADTQMPVFPQAYATGTGTAIDPWAGWQANTYTACPTGGTIYFRAGYYVLSAQWSISKSINIIGEGMGRTFIVTSGETGFSIGADYVTMKDLTVDGDAQASTAYLSCIRIGTYSEHALFRNIETKNAGYYGWNIYEVNDCVWENIYTHDNFRHGMHPASDREGWNLRNTYRNIYAWNNTNLGFADRGNGESALGVWGEITNNVYDNIQTWDNGIAGMQIACQKNIVISNCQAWGNGATGGETAGIWIEHLTGANLTNCIAYDNDEQGFYADFNLYINMSNCVSVDNDSYGLNIWDVDYMEISNCHFYDTATVQTYGIYLAGGAYASTNIHLSGCNLVGNVTGKISGTTAGIVTSSEGVMDGTKAVAGDIQYHNGTTWVRLAKGTANQYLKMNGTATAPVWVT